MATLEETEKKVDEKEIDFFIERLAEILLMQIEQKVIVQPVPKTIS
jgi:hypothetical protein